jgi:hypothetical protein
MALTQASNLRSFPTFDLYRKEIQIGAKVEVKKLENTSTHSELATAEVCYRSNRYKGEGTVYRRYKQTLWLIKMDNGKLAVYATSEFGPVSELFPAKVGFNQANASTD